jgi:hypothetical protein
MPSFSSRQWLQMRAVKKAADSCVNFRQLHSQMPTTVRGGESRKKKNP